MPIRLYSPSDATLLRIIHLISSARNALPLGRKL